MTARMLGLCLGCGRSMACIMFRASGSLARAFKSACPCNKGPRFQQSRLGKEWTQLLHPLDCSEGSVGKSAVMTNTVPHLESNSIGG